MKIYKNLVSQFQNMTPEEKRQMENAMIRIASLAGVVAFFLLLKLLEI